MPKYIRTKDGIYEVEKTIQTKEKNFYEVKGLNYVLMPEIMIISKSDNLEELCDVVVETKGHTGEWIHYQYTNFNEPMKKDLLNDIIEQDFEVYYAIWTDKGLIYVAKMNEDGKLVLI